jgi:hypothetical protein
MSYLYIIYVVKTIFYQNLLYVMVTGSVSWLTQAPGALSNGSEHLPSGSLFRVANSFKDFSAKMWKK